MDRLEILVNLYSIENRLLNVKLSNYDKQQAKLKFNKLLGELFRYKIEYKKREKTSSPEKLMSYLIKKFDFPEDFATNKTRAPKLVESRNIYVVLLRHIFKELTLVDMMARVGLNHAKYYDSIRYVKNRYDTELEFRDYFKKIEKSLTGIIKICE